MGRTRSFARIFGYNAFSTQPPGSFSMLDDVIKSRFNIIALLAYVFLSMIVWSFATWSKELPDLYFALQGTWMMATTGWIVHIPFWAPALQLTFAGTTFDNVFYDAVHVGIGVSCIIIAQVFVRITLVQTPLSVIGLSFGAEELVYSAAGIAEEFAFAFLTLTLILWLLKPLEWKAVPIALITNATIFALFHYRVRFIYYAGDATYLPAILISRIVLDSIYIASKGALHKNIMIHTATNLFLSWLT